MRFDFIVADVIRAFTARMGALAGALVVAATNVAEAQVQNVRVDTIPEGARLVCDGVRRGRTPTVVDVSGMHSCTAFLPGYENQTFRVDDLDGPMLRLPLVAVRPEPAAAAPTAVTAVPLETAPLATRPESGAPCMRPDANGLIQPCFGDAPAPRAETRQAVPACVPQRDPVTGLLRPCFVRTSAPSATQHGSVVCGRPDPSTGLLVPCFASAREPRRPAARRSLRDDCTPRRDPVSGLLMPCF